MTTSLSDLTIPCSDVTNSNHHKMRMRVRVGQWVNEGEGDWVRGCWEKMRMRVRVREVRGRNEPKKEKKKKHSRETERGRRAWGWVRPREGGRRQCVRAWEWVRVGKESGWGAARVAEWNERRFISVYIYIYIRFFFGNFSFKRV